MGGPGRPQPLPSARGPPTPLGPPPTGGHGSGPGEVTGRCGPTPAESTDSGRDPQARGRPAAATSSRLGPAHSGLSGLRPNPRTHHLALPLGALPAPSPRLRDRGLRDRGRRDASSRAGQVRTAAGAAEERWTRDWSTPSSDLIGRRSGPCALIGRRPDPCTLIGSSSWHRPRSRGLRLTTH